jgi:hypothetical protein
MGPIRKLLPKLDKSASGEEKVFNYERMHEDLEVWFRRRLVASPPITNPSDKDLNFYRNVVHLSKFCIHVDEHGKESLSPTSFIHPALPINVFADLFDSVTIGVAEKMFCVLEEFTDLWKSPAYVDSIRNAFLRLCTGTINNL